MSRFQPALLGGVVIGVLSGLPFVNIGNCCCCLWVVAGGVLTVYLQQQARNPVPLETIGAFRSLGAATGGFALVNSNSFTETFERIVAAGAKQAGREVRVFERRGPAADHLLPPAFTEGQYLKVLLCYVT